MKTSRVIRRAGDLARPHRVTDGQKFRLKDVDPGDTGTLKRFSDRERHPDNEDTPGVSIFRIEASLLYFNVDHVLREVLRHFDAQPEGVRLVVCDLSTSPYVDLAGGRMPARLCDELATRNVALRLAETHATVREILRAEGLDARVGLISRLTSVADAVEAFEREGAAS